MRRVNGNSKLLHLFTVGREERNPRPRGEIRTDYNNIITIFILFALFIFRRSITAPVVRYYYLNNIMTILILCTDQIRLGGHRTVHCWARDFYYQLFCGKRIIFRCTNATAARRGSRDDSGRGTVRVREHARR